MKSNLRVAVSARSLFNLEELHNFFKIYGLEAYLKRVRSGAHERLDPGPALPLIRSLLRLNQAYGNENLIDVIIASSIHPEAGTMLLEEMKRHGIDIVRSSFTGGGPTIPYLQGFETDLLLTRSRQDAQEAVNAGIAAALMYDFPGSHCTSSDLPIRIAFDADAVLFSDDSEKIFKSEGLERFMEHEGEKALEPMREGPFANLLRGIGAIQEKCPPDIPAFRIAVFTARGGPARERVLRTFGSWGVKVDEIHFLNGYKKAQLLAAFKPHIFFDDQETHVGPASELVPSALVPYADH